MVFTWESSTARSKTELGSILSGYRSTKESWDPQRQAGIKNRKAQGIWRLCWLYCLSFIFTLLQTVLSVVLFRSTCLQRLAWQLLSPHFQAKPQRRTVFPSLGLMSLSGPVIHGWWCVHALGDNMGGPPDPVAGSEHSKEGSSLHRGDKAFPTHIALTYCCGFIH